MVHYVWRVVAGAFTVIKVALLSGSFGNAGKSLPPYLENNVMTLSFTWENMSCRGSAALIPHVPSLLALISNIRRIWSIHYGRLSYFTRVKLKHGAPRRIVILAFPCPDAYDIRKKY